MEAAAVAISCWKVGREARMEPPIHTECFLSGGAMLTFMVEGARVEISFSILSAMLGYMAVPPERTMLANVLITLHYGVVDCLMNPTGLHAQE